MNIITAVLNAFMKERNRVAKEKLGPPVTVASPHLMDESKEPDGFRGIKWGTDISTLSGMNRCPEDSPEPHMAFYTREGDELQIGGAKLSIIAYGFYKHKFLVATLFTDNPIDFYALKDIVFEKFGSGDQPNKHKEEWLWLGKIAGIHLKYDKSSQEGSLWICSEKIRLQEKEDKKQKAKEGAEKGF